MSKAKFDDIEVRRNLSKRWYNMISRCSDVGNSNYGGCGVSVCPRWQDKENFINDCQGLPGYNREALLTGSLYLDKDSIISGNKIYSPETCCFLTVAESNAFKPNQMATFVAISPDGDVYESNNQSAFASEHNLLQTAISRCLRGAGSSHNGWTFKFKV